MQFFQEFPGLVAISERTQQADIHPARATRIREFRVGQDQLFAGPSEIAFARIERRQFKQRGEPETPKLCAHLKCPGVSSQIRQNHALQILIFEVQCPPAARNSFIGQIPASCTDSCSGR